MVPGNRLGGDDVLGVIHEDVTRLERETGGAAGIGLKQLAHVR